MTSIWHVRQVGRNKYAIYNRYGRMAFGGRTWRTYAAAAKALAQPRHKVKHAKSKPVEAVSGGLPTLGKKR
jgi:alpha-beta hydrolase superfamily lysophospholipase